MKKDDLYDSLNCDTSHNLCSDYVNVAGENCHIYQELNLVTNDETLRASYGLDLSPARGISDDLSIISIYTVNDTVNMRKVHKIFPSYGDDEFCSLGYMNPNPR